MVDGGGVFLVIVDDFPPPKISALRTLITPISLISRHHDTPYTCPVSAFMSSAL